MKKRKLSYILIMGISLILTSFSLIIAVQIRMRMGYEQSHRIALKLDEILLERTPGVPEIYPNFGMPVLEIDGVDYVALLEIPSFGVVLPVTGKWDSNKLSHSPARFLGSTYDSTLIIGGVDYPQQFGFCDKIEHGALVTVTDMTGVRFAYTVSRVDRAKHAETQWLTDASCDLTLFCHDIYSMEYIAVRCDFVYS